MPIPIVPLSSLNDFLPDDTWRISDRVAYIEGLHRVGRKKTEVFNFVIGCPSETCLVVEAWEEKGIICKAVIQQEMQLIIGKAELVPDTYTHKYRIANSPYRIRLKYGSEISRQIPSRNLVERLATVSYLAKMPEQREISDPGYLVNERYYVLAKIKTANKDNNLYKTCTSPSCPRRTIFCWGNTPSCSECDDLSDEFRWTFRILLTLYFDDSEVKVTIFGERAEKLFGLTGEEGYQKRKTDPSEYAQVFKRVEDKPMVFRIRPHFYNGKIAYTVCEHFDT